MAQLAEPEVGELGVAVIDEEEYVGRLDVVLVDDRWVGLGVEVVESLSYVQCDAEAGFDQVRGPTARPW